MEHLWSRAGANGDRARIGGPATRYAHALSASRHAGTVAAINGTIGELNGAGSTRGRSVAAPTGEPTAAGTTTTRVGHQSATEKPTANTLPRPHRNVADSDVGEGRVP